MGLRKSLLKEKGPFRTTMEIGFSAVAPPQPDLNHNTECFVGAGAFILGSRSFTGPF
jgi:hypothetical protein